ncbi:hypothetical protein M378DRAFT_173987 [Amanita muscaria Koide BX008]|uniref:Uncharacterized protein n=1 Tax=Amanita muscaria (strain Koide BX008) TaxID=946122 RepID=A0A0C2SLQ2_AMAMK|nr:hypothetical protein M378DRAFT_173987 [Amanita muscaria Koide BX008]
MVVATSPSQIDEIRRANDDTLSPLEAARDVLFYTLFLSTITNCYPTKSLHANLTIGPEPFDFKYRRHRGTKKHWREVC